MASAPDESAGNPRTKLGKSNPPENRQDSTAENGHGPEQDASNANLDSSGHLAPAAFENLLISAFIGQKVKSITLQSAKEAIWMAMEEARLKQEVLPKNSEPWHHLAGEILAYNNVLQLLERIPKRPE